MNITKLARCELGMTQEQFAEHMGVPTQEQVSAWENSHQQVSTAYRAKFAPLASEALARLVEAAPDHESRVRLLREALLD